MLRYTGTGYKGRYRPPTRPRGVGLWGCGPVPIAHRPQDARVPNRQNAIGPSVLRSPAPATLTPRLIIDVTTKTGLIGCSRPYQTSSIHGMVQA